MINLLIRFTVYGALGCFMEVIWTGLGALIKRNFKMIATTSLWMFPIYGMAIFLEPIGRLIAPFPFPIRGLIYSCCIFAGEFITGSLLKRADLCPWDYTGARYQVKGLIRLDYLPAWGAVGLIFEYVHIYLS